MRLQISHATHYAYEQPARSIVQVLRLTPRDHEGQHVCRWRIEPSVEGRLASRTDHFGNVVHVFSADDAVEDMTITASGEVETADTSGIVRQAVELVPDGCYMRATELTEPDEAIRALAEKHRDPAGNVLSTLHHLMAAVHERVAFDQTSTGVATKAAQALALGRGVCQDLSQVFIAAARHLRIPARYVSGYVLAPDGIAGQQASHAWCEARVPYLGWVGFDPTHLTCPGSSHVRVAIGLDYHDAAPVRGSRRGGGRESMEVRLRVEPVQGGQVQRQG
jgi:transglutaminase-like putative cysteine protease